MASVKFLLNRPKGTKPCSILTRFHSRETGTITLSTSEMVHPDHWDGNRVTSKDRKQYDRINKRLASIEAALLDVWRHNIGNGEVISREVHRIVKGTSAVQKKTVIEAVKLFIAQYEREKEKTTVGRYKVLLNKLTAFNPDLTFEQLDHNFYDAFKTFLYQSPNPVYGNCHLEYDRDSGVWIVRDNERGRSADSYEHSVPLMDDVVFKYIVQIKTICGWAKDRGYNVNGSYKAWEVLKREYIPISLTLEELESIESLPLPKHLDLARDYFVLECRTGQRISDIKRFNKIQLQDNKWVFTPKKGNRTSSKMVKLPFVGYSYPALLIFQKYNYQLPELSEQNLNYSIKEVCRRAGIDDEIFIERWAGSKKIRIPGKKYEFLSTHTGKKTFITVLANKGVPLLTISQITQTSVKTIERHYLGLIEDENVSAHLSKIETKYTLRKVN
jgi:hypothetical protein